jgi:hypothetical protein
MLPLILSYFNLHPCSCHWRFLVVFAMFIIWVLEMISLTLMLLNVSFLIIPQPKRDIVSTLLFFDTTSLASMSCLLNLPLIFLVLLLWVILLLSLMSHPYWCMFRPCLSLSLLLLQSSCLYACLPLSRSIHIALDHQLLHPLPTSLLSIDPASPLASVSLPIALQKGNVLVHPTSYHSVCIN